MNIGRPLPSLQMIWASITSGIKVAVGKNAPETAEALFFMKSIIGQGKLKPVIDRTFSIDQIVEAHRYADKGHKKGNVVISVH
ncbi:zinc-binding dehydrogenase [uncultured Eudoraea sp.]|uniref:zinc-binding dehydrogenase n=1 Tax=uncultured Eudoraea sp. TaxID=1035614 RepID=UPI00345BE620